MTFQIPELIKLYLNFQKPNKLSYQNKITEYKEKFHILGMQAKENG